MLYITGRCRCAWTEFNVWLTEPVNGAVFIVMKLLTDVQAPNLSPSIKPSLYQLVQRISFILYYLICNNFCEFNHLHQFLAMAWGSCEYIAKISRKNYWWHFYLQISNEIDPLLANYCIHNTYVFIALNVCIFLQSIQSSTRVIW